MNGSLALRNFPRMQHRETKIKMRNCMEDAVRGSGHSLIGVAEEETEKTEEARPNESLQTWRKT